jgi:hypothetical protein
VCPGLFYLYTHLFGVLGTHFNLFRTSSHTQRGALGQITGLATFMVFSTLWFCGFFLSMFIWILYLWLLYLYLSISTTCTHTHSVVVVSLEIYFYCVQTHTLFECSLPFYLNDTHTFCVCVWSVVLSSHTHTHTTLFPKMKNL